MWFINNERDIKDHYLVYRQPPRKEPGIILWIWLNEFSLKKQLGSYASTLFFLIIKWVNISSNDFPFHIKTLERIWIFEPSEWAAAGQAVCSTANSHLSIFQAHTSHRNVFSAAVYRAGYNTGTMWQQNSWWYCLLVVFVFCFLNSRFTLHLPHPQRKLSQQYFQETLFSPRKRMLSGRADQLSRGTACLRNRKLIWAARRAGMGRSRKEPSWGRVKHTES